MPIIEVVLSKISSHLDAPDNRENELSLFYTVFDIPPARKWLKYLQAEIDQGSPIETNELSGQTVAGKFNGFPKWLKTTDELVTLLNDKIDIVNSYEPDIIPIRAHNSVSQSDLNELHKYFETLRGRTIAPSVFFTEAPISVQAALEDFNILIHECEFVLSALNEHHPTYAMGDVCFLGKRIRHPFNNEDFQYFDFHVDFGGLYLHYCDVGKQVLDVFRDQDDHVGLGNIRPLEKMSADFDMFFGQTNKANYDLQFKVKLANWLKEIGLDISDPKLSLGHIKLGQLIMDNRIKNFDQAQIMNIVSGYLNVSRVEIHGD